VWVVCFCFYRRHQRRAKAHLNPGVVAPPAPHPCRPGRAVALVEAPRAADLAIRVRRLVEACGLVPADLGFGRIVVSENEAPRSNRLVNRV
jgi:hypothetical protein